ncbi:hypothetical protein TNCV_586881 [Trichonephila clavipes]|nr:hypothetical protein TNCV_586881 [Trichonephila clavipes]
MERSTNTELVDTHLICGLAEGKAREAERLYREKYPQRDALDQRVFTNLRHNLYEYGSLRSNRHSAGGPRVAQTPSRVPFEGIRVPACESLLLP